MSHDQSNEQSMKELVEFVTRALVDDVSRVQVNEVVGDHTTVIEVKVAKEDRGKVIGRGGRTAEAIRTILGCAAAKYKKRFSLHVIDE